MSPARVSHPLTGSVDVLAEMNAFSLVGRYPEMLEPAPAAQEAVAYLDRAKEVFSWLLATL